MDGIDNFIVMMILIGGFSALLLIGEITCIIYMKIIFPKQKTAKEKLKQRKIHMHNYQQFLKHKHI